MAITLPTQPTGKQFEEAVAALVRSFGYFTENRTVFDYEGREVLELDVVASPASDDFTRRILVDARRRTARFADIFKIFGWRTFLKIPKGCIVHGSEMGPHELAAFNNVCPNLEVYADHFDVAAAQPQRLPSVPIINKSAEEPLRWAAAKVGWYQLIADRLVLEQFRTQRKAAPDDPLLARVREYRRGCQVAFFEPDPFRRAELLYQAYKNDPGISGQCVDWQANKSGESQDKVWKAVRDTHEVPWIQHVISLEVHARILIIKNGLEAALQSEAAERKCLAF
jgi:hypothetical protein